LTCIIGLETTGGVIIGGDSASSSALEIEKTRVKKVFRRGRFLIGYTTSFRMGQILQYQLEVTKQVDEQSDLEYLSTTFIDAVRKCLKVGGFRKTENEQEEGGEFLVGYKDKLYTVYSDFQVNTNADGFAAIGCGASYALGNMWGSSNKRPEKRIKQALKTAGHFSNRVCGPYHVVAVDLWGEVCSKSVD
jgi:ATP-dependent protease HslVU (ClpYQ) peptidase subunit